MLYDISQLKFLFSDDHAFLKDVIKQFIDDVVAAEADIQQAYANGDFEQEKYHLHRLKSPVNNFGANKVSVIVDILEGMAAENKNNEEHANLIKQLNVELAAVIEALKVDHAI